jgi:SAM dependent carboxyl methyltransferase
MSEDAVPKLPAMQGAGFYNRHSAMQAAGISRILSLWATACESVQVGEEPLVIVDYASSQGRNSMTPVRMAIEKVRERCGAEKLVEVVHTDLPSNDFSSLFTALQQEPGSYLRGTTGVFPAAIGRSYFEPLLPPGRVHLGWNTWSMQWMSRNPADAPDHILAGMSASAPVIAAVKEQQAADWRRFLTLRATELRQGGRLLVGYTARTATETGWEWLLGELWESVQDMGRAGLYSEDERTRLTIPIGLRTLDEIRAPFAESGKFSGLRIEHCEIVKVADPYWKEYQHTGDARQLASRQTNTMRAWSGPAILDLIDAARDREALCNDLFSRFAERIRSAPRRHEPHMAVVLLRK